MRRIWSSLLAMLAGVAAFAQTPVVRARLEPSTGILVGQPVRLVVSVFVPNYFTGSPEFPEFELDNAIVVLPQDRPQNSNEQIGGVTYAGITETYTIYPQQPGDFRLPVAAITVSYASAPPKSTVAHVPLPVVDFHAEIPAEARGLDYFLPTSQLSIQERWSPSLKGVHAGDSVERTITVTASRMQAMLIPPLPLEAPDGIRVYQEEPSVQDQKTDRGEFISGRRVQSAKYFIQKPGDYTLPAIEVKWWNLSSNHLVSSTLPALHFTAAANPNYVTELPPELEPTPVTQARRVSWWTKYKFWIRLAAPCGLGVVILIWLCLRYFPRLYRRLQLWRKQREHSEPAYFRKLERACRHNDATQGYEWLLKWLSLAYPDVTLHQFLSGADDPELSSEMNKLGAFLFAKNNQDAHWAGKKMAEILKQHRKMQIAVTGRVHDLLKLNPADLDIRR